MRFLGGSLLILSTTVLRGGKNHISFENIDVNDVIDPEIYVEVHQFMGCNQCYFDLMIKISP